VVSQTAAVLSVDEKALRSPAIVLWQSAKVVLQAAKVLRQPEKAGA